MSCNTKYYNKDWHDKHKTKAYADKHDDSKGYSYSYDYDYDYDYGRKPCHKHHDECHHDHHKKKCHCKCHCKCCCKCCCKCHKQKKESCHDKY